MKDIGENVRKTGLRKKIRLLYVIFPLRVKLYGSINENYIIRKGKLTRFLYIKNGCRVHFTDADILTMLLQIQNKDTMTLLLKIWR